MQEYEHEEQNEVLKDESHDFVTQAVEVAMERKDLAFCDDPRILAQNNLYFSYVSYICFMEWSLIIQRIGVSALSLPTPSWEQTSS